MPTAKKDENMLESQLKDISGAITEPGKKAAGTIGHILDVLNPLSKSEKYKEQKEETATIRTVKQGEITWIDIKNPTKKETTSLGEEYSFNTFHLKAVLGRGQLGRVEFEDKYMFMLINFPRSESSENKIITSQICFFVGKNYVITTHTGKPEALEDFFTSCENDKEKRELFFKKSSGFLLYNILEALAKDLSDIILHISQELDEVEDLVFDVKVSATYKISQLRQKIIRLRRITGTMRGIAEQLSLDKSTFLGEGMQRYYKNIFNSLNKIWESLEEVRETAEIYKDTDFTVSSEKTNKILTVLTIIFTLTFPLSLLASFYGMNILLPGGIESGPWTFWGEFTTFYIILGVSFFVIILMLWYFKRKDWF